MRFPGIVMILCGFASSCLAFWSGSGDGYSSDIVGSIRITGGYLTYPASFRALGNEDDWTGAAVARVIARGSFHGARYECNLFHEYSDLAGSPTQGVFATASSFESTYRHGSLTGRYAEDGSASGFYGVDRLSFIVEPGPSLTIGRFPVNYSVTSLFAPNDFFAPYSPSAINKIYKPGVDGVRLALGLGMLSGAELVGVAGHDADDGPVTWSSSALLARMGTVLWGAEWAALGGKLAQRWVVGGSVQYDLSVLTGRAEWHVGVPDGDAGTRDEDPYVRAAVGFDTIWTWCNASLAAEYLFLSDGARETAEYAVRAQVLFPDDQRFLGRHYAGLTAGFDLLPIVRLQAVTYLNAGDGSGLCSVMLDWSAGDEIALVGGVVATWGDDSFSSDAVTGNASIGSEYGVSPKTAYVEARLYF